MASPDEWDPLKELKSVQQRLNDLFENALARTEFEAQEGLDTWTPVSDVLDTDAALLLCLELPGLEQDQIKLRLDGDELVVEGVRSMDREQVGERFHRVERSYGKFARRFRLPSTVNRDAIEATYRHGLLEIVVPHGGNRPPKTVPIEIG